MGAALDRALIGCTGFVGSNLLSQTTFTRAVHRPDASTLRGRSFDLVVCAGAPAEKWRANAEPEADRANIDRLSGLLASITAERFVLVSTVDVYPRPIGVDEDDAIDDEASSPYGRHRHALEQRCRELFASCLVVRLPALFGDGLKKNVVFDLLNGRGLRFANAASTYQFYGLDRLWTDVSALLQAGATTVNLVTPPLSVRQVARDVFGETDPGSGDAAPAAYDVRTRHAGMLGAAGPYMTTTEEALDRLRLWVAAQRAARAT